jgi:hypothetical protein
LLKLVHLFLLLFLHMFYGHVTSCNWYLKWHLQHLNLSFMLQVLSPILTPILEHCMVIFLGDLKNVSLSLLFNIHWNVPHTHKHQYQSLCSLLYMT